MSMLESKFQLLPPRPSDEDEWDQHVDSAHALCRRCEQKLSGERSLMSRYKVGLTFVFVQVVIILSCLGLWWTLYQHVPSSSTSFGREYKGLSEYNTMKSEFGPMNAADASEAADKFWSHYKSLPGLIVLGNELKDHIDLPPTASYRNDPSHGIYQISSFHSLHCLYRIRNRLLSEIPLDQWPRRDPHTMHCLDHIREDIMCNPDLSLRGTEDRIAFNIKPAGGVQCRNLDAVIDWAAQHVATPERQDGPEDYPPPLDFVKIEKWVWKQKIELEQKAGRQIGYDEFDYTTDDAEGMVTLDFPKKNGTKSGHVS